MSAESRPVVLVHGLLRTSFSMAPLARTLRRHGWSVSGFTRNSLASLESQAHALEGHTNGVLARHPKRDDAAPCFVTYSMGALVLRRMLARTHLPVGTRVVMLAPPNTGSRLARHVSARLFRGRWTDLDPLRSLHSGETGAPRGPLPDIGIIAGVKPEAGPARAAPPLHDVVRSPAERLHDGKVFVDETHLPFARDFIAMPYEHNDLLRRPDVAHEVGHFLRTSTFSPSARHASAALVTRPPGRR